MFLFNLYALCGNHNCFITSGEKGDLGFTGKPGSMGPPGQKGSLGEMGIPGKNKFIFVIFTLIHV